MILKTNLFCKYALIVLLMFFLPQASHAQLQKTSDEKSQDDTIQKSDTEEASEQPQEEAEEELIEAEQIVITASRIAEDLFYSPTAVSVLTAADLSAQSDPILPNVLSGFTGVTIQNTTSAQGSPYIRGVTGTDVLILVDGIRLNNAIFRNAPNQYMALVNRFDIDRVEVIRGTASTLYGSDAMGGVIHLITVKPKFQSASFQWKSDSQVQFMSADLSDQFHLGLSAGNRHLANRLSLYFGQFRDLRDGSGEKQSPTGFDAYAGSFRSVYEPSLKHHVLLDVQFYEQPKTPRYDEVSIGFGQTEPNFDRFDFEPNRRIFAHGGYRLRLDLPHLSQIEADLAFQEIVDDRKTVSHGETDLNHERNKDDLFSGTLQFYAPIADWMNTIWGIEVYEDYVFSDRIKIAEDGTESEKTSRFPDGSRIGSYALYLKNRFLPLESVQLSLGGRLSLFDIAIDAADRPEGVNETIYDVTGQSGFTYAVAPSWHLVGNVGRGFRVPNVNDFSKFSASANRFDTPNPNLKPEQVISTDLGVKAFQSVLQGEVFGFYSRYFDRIVSEKVSTGKDCDDLAEQFDEIVSTADGCTIDDLPVYAPQNANRVDILGVEGSLLVSLFHHWKARGRITYTYGEEEDEDGETYPADRIPPLGGETGLRFEAKKWWADAFLRFAGSQDRLHPINLEDPRINPEGTPRWLTLNVATSWLISSAWTFHLSVENITDSFYRVHGSGIDAPGINVIVSLRALLGSEK